MLLKENHFVSVEQIKNKSEYESLFPKNKAHSDYARVVRYKDSLPDQLQKFVYVNEQFATTLFIINIEKLHFEILPDRKSLTTNYSLLNNISNTPLIAKFNISEVRELIKWRLDKDLDEKVWDAIVNKFLTTVENVDIHLLMFVTKCILDIITHLDSDVFFLAERQIAKRDVVIKTYLRYRRNYLDSKNIDMQIAKWLRETNFSSGKSTFEKVGLFNETDFLNRIKRKA